MSLGSFPVPILAAELAQGRGTRGVPRGSVGEHCSRNAVSAKPCLMGDSRTGRAVVRRAWDSRWGHWRVPRSRSWASSRKELMGVTLARGDLDPFSPRGGCPVASAGGEK